MPDEATVTLARLTMVLQSKGWVVFLLLHNNRVILQRNPQYETAPEVLEGSARHPHARFHPAKFQFASLSGSRNVTLGRLAAHPCRSVQNWNPPWRCFPGCIQSTATFRYEVRLGDHHAARQDDCGRHLLYCAALGLDVQREEDGWLWKRGRRSLPREASMSMGALACWGRGRWWRVEMGGSSGRG